VDKQIPPPRPAAKGVRPEDGFAVTIQIPALAAEHPSRLAQARGHLVGKLLNRGVYVAGLFARYFDEPTQLSQLNPDQTELNPRPEAYTLVNALPARSKPQSHSDDTQI